MKMNALATPGKYFQGQNILEELRQYISYLGTKFAIVADEFVLSLLERRIGKSFEHSNADVDFFLFKGETTRKEADELYKAIIEKSCDVIVGVGGGKTIDTAKLIAHMSHMPLVIIPTVASSDAPCSAISVVYTEEGTFLEAVKLNKNPDVVLVDTEVIAKAPIRTLRAGIGDAFSTYYEARACKQSEILNFNGGSATNAGYALAVLCNDILLEYGEDAIKAAKQGVCNESLEKVIEANIYLSGVGFENNGCAIAHAFYSGLTAIIKPFTAFHGEAVALGTLVQLLTEGISANKLNSIMLFYKEVGLPVSLEDLGIINIDQKKLFDIAKATCTCSKNAHHMPFNVTPEIIMKAMKKLNQFNQ